jgi:hypothetical protein
MSPIVLFKHHGNAFGTAHIADALRSAGSDAIEVKTAKMIPTGSQVLVVGLGRLEQVPEVETFLREAGERNIARLLWHLEPTLPPGITGSGSKIVNWLLRDSTFESKRGRIARAGDRLACHALAAITRDHRWSNHVPSGEVFKYPLAQSRFLMKSWSEGLIDQIFVSLPTRGEFLAERGIASTFLPVGHIPSFGKWSGRDERDIDVLFFGRISNRRRKLLRHLRKEIARCGFALVVVERDCYGDERTELLNRSKIVLNLHKFPWEFPAMRLLMAMSCKALVVSEASPDTRPYADGDHLITSSIDSLADTLARYLREPDLRRRIVERAYRLVMEEMQLAKLLRGALATAKTAG